MRPRSTRCTAISALVRNCSPFSGSISTVPAIRPCADADADGVQENAAIDDVHVGGEAVERHVAALDLRSAIFQVHVGRQQLRQANRLGRQQPRTGLGPRHRLALLRRLVRRVHPTWLGAEEAAEIGEIDLAGRDIGGDHWAFLPGIDLDIPLHVARSELAGEVAKADLAVGIVQIAFDLVRRGLRKGDADQRQQQFHVGAGQLQLQVRPGEVQRVLHGADQRGARRPVRHLQVNGIRRGGVAQRQQSAADENRIDRWPA